MAHRPSFLPLLLLLAAMSASFPARPLAATRINTIVVLVLENRSFDHMLGWLRRPDIDGLTGRECNPAPNATAICVSDDAQYVALDPGHSFADVLEQVFGSSSGADRRIPSMSGFVNSARSISASLQRTVMSCFSPASVPVYAALAGEFAVFDRWFSSIPGPTQPNRLFVYSATSHGAVAHDKLLLAGGYPQRTIFDSLAADGLPFGVYFKTLPTTLFYRSLRRISFAGSFHSYGKFIRDAAAGALPSLSVVEPRYFGVAGEPAYDDHPAHDVANGQMLVKEVYEALRSGPQWNESLLIITYDEHGGFYDHVGTPFAGVPSPDGIAGAPPYFFRFDRLGVRVPTIMASPWIKKGTVVHRPPAGPTDSSEYEHSSIPATVKKLFNLSSGFLTRRDAWAGTFEHLFAELAAPRTDCPLTLPAPPRRPAKQNEKAPLSEFQGELVDLAAALSGDYFLSSFEETRRRMSVKEADAYVRRATASFLRAGREAAALGADGDAVVTMRTAVQRRRQQQPTAIP